jgi:hypothetical protein
MLILGIAFTGSCAAWQLLRSRRWIRAGQPARWLRQNRQQQHPGEILHAGILSVVIDLFHRAARA